MALRSTPVLEMYPSRYPSASVLGDAVVLGIFVPGEPVAKDRPRVKLMPAPKSRTGWAPQLYTTKATADYEKLVGETALMQMRSVDVLGDGELLLPVKDCRIMATLRFNFEKPASYPKRKVHMVQKPDLDNLVKAIFDGLVKYGVIEDDKRVTDEFVCKRYVDGEHPLGVEIELTCLPF
jgi:Holliday junction resolvase RusA-like endonuclease